MSEPENSEKHLSEERSKLVEIAVHYPVTTISGVLMVMLFGTIGIINLPVQLTPTIDRPTITIQTSYPGAAPQEVEQQVTNLIEEKVNSVENLRRVTSSSQVGRSNITLEFDWGIDKDLAVVDVMRKVNQVSGLPENVDQPIITAASSDEEQPILRIAVVSELDPSFIREVLDRDIQPRLLRVSGVGDVTFNGGQEREVRVTVDPHRLTAYRLTVENVRSAILDRNRNLQAGDIEKGQVRWIVRTVGEYNNLSEIEETPIRAGDGAWIHLSDVATVTTGYKDPEAIVRINGRPANVLNVNKKTGGNTIEVASGITAVVEEINREYSSRGIQLLPVVDDSDYIWASIRTVLWSLVQGTLLAVVILYVFMGSFRTVAIIGMAIPISLVGTFALLWGFDRSLNIISLAGLGFASGMVVDNAVVVVENIVRHRENGKGLFQAAVDGTSEVWGAVIASTVTTLAVFIPVLFVEEEAGQLFRDIAYAISFAIGLSLVISVTIIPTFAARVLKIRTGAETGESGPYAALRRVFLGATRRIGEAFMRTLTATLDRVLVSRRRCGIVVGIVVAATLALMTLLPPAEYLPSGSRNFIITSMRIPPGLSLAAVDEMVFTLQSRYASLPEKEAMFAVTRPNGCFIGVIVKPELADRIPEIIGRMRKMAADITQAQVIIQQASIFQRGIAGGKTIAVEVHGDDITQLIAYAEEVEAAAKAIPGVETIRSSLELGNPEIRVALEPDRLSELGLSTREVGEIVEAMVDGRRTGVYRAGGTEQEVDLNVIGSRTLAADAQALAAIPIWSDGTHVVPLSSVGRVGAATGPTRIDHADLARSITLTVFVAKEMPLQPVIDELNRALDGGIRPRMPTGYSIHMTGAADDLQRTISALVGAFIVAVFISYLLMASLFESFVYPFIVTAVVPIGMVGAIAGVLATGEQLNVITMLGFIILAGTVVNNAILLVHQTLNFEKDGLDFLPALRMSVITRVRPITMTTATSVLAMAPLAFGHGSGSELYRGLGAAVLFGLALSTFIILFFTPALFAFVSRRARFGESSSSTAG